MKWQIHVAAVTWQFVNSLIMILCNNKYNSVSTISIHNNDVLEEDGTRMNDKYFPDLRRNSSEELQRLEFKRLKITSRRDFSEELRKCYYK